MLCAIVIFFVLMTILQITVSANKDTPPPTPKENPVISNVVINLYKNITDGKYKS